MTGPAAINTGTQVLEPPTAEEQALPTSKKQLGLTIRNAAQLPAELWPDERISAIRAYVGKEATNIGELAAFLATCQRYSLDPMVGQLFLIKSDSGPKVCTGRDTWLALARREAGYGGILFDQVHEKDEFGYGRGADGKLEVHHKVLGVKRGALIGFYALVRDKLLGDNIVVRELQDFNHLLSKNNWKNYKADMGVNRCIAAVLRKEYGFPGLLITGEEDELADETARPMPPADAVVSIEKGAGAGLADAVRAARAARTVDAEEVRVEQPDSGFAPVEGAGDSVKVAPEGAQRAHPTEEAKSAPAKPAPSAEPAKLDPDEEERLRRRPQEYETFKRLAALGSNRTAMQDVKLDQLNEEYPEFDAGEYPAPAPEAAQ